MTWAAAAVRVGLLVVANTALPWPAAGAHAVGRVRELVRASGSLLLAAVGTEESKGLLAPGVAVLGAVAGVQGLRVALGILAREAVATEGEFCARDKGGALVVVEGCLKSGGTTGVPLPVDAGALHDAVAVPLEAVDALHDPHSAVEGILIEQKIVAPLQNIKIKLYFQILSNPQYQQHHPKTRRVLDRIVGYELLPGGT